MNIIFGVSGQGCAAAKTALAIAAELDRRGHTVLVLTHDDAHKYFAKNGWPPRQLQQIDGLTLGDNAYGISIKNSIKRAIRWRMRLKDAVRTINLHIWRQQPCLAITNYEPLLSYCANRNKIPIIAIENKEVCLRTSRRIGRLAKIYRWMLTLYIRASIGFVDLRIKDNQTKDIKSLCEKIEIAGLRCKSSGD